MPFLIFAITLLARCFLQDDTIRDLVSDIRRDLWLGVGPGIGLSFVFGLAAILNYAPAKRLGLVRCIMGVGLVSLGGVALSELAASIVDIAPQTYTSDPWAWLRTLIVVSVPVAYTVIHTAVRITRREGNAHT
jgi:hypothetical protein